MPKLWKLVFCVWNRINRVLGWVFETRIQLDVLEKVIFYNIPLCYWLKNSSPLAQIAPGSKVQLSLKPDLLINRPAFQLLHPWLKQRSFNLYEVTIILEQC